MSIFISLQIKEFRIMGLSINDSVYSCVFFFLTGLHFFHLVVGLLLLSLLSWSSTFPSHVYTFINLRISEVYLFYNILNFYWHFLEILWLFIFLFLYSLFSWVIDCYFHFLIMCILISFLLLWNISFIILPQDSLDFSFY